MAPLRFTSPSPSGWTEVLSACCPLIFGTPKAISGRRAADRLDLVMVLRGVSLMATKLRGNGQPSSTPQSRVQALAASSVA
jgi:hypothetical protein